MPFISKTLEGIITSWNKSAERIFGYSAEEALGQPITMLIPQDRIDEETRIIESLRRGERVAPFDTIRLRKDGTQVHVSVTISPLWERRSPSFRVAAAFAARG
jgi:PAS domain S-box-containing protein